MWGVNVASSPTFRPPPLTLVSAGRGPADYPTGMTSLDPDAELPQQKRTVSDAARVTREAIALVRPLHDKIGAWQAESVRLEARAKRMAAFGRHDPGVAEAMATLLGFVEEETRQFDLLVAEAPPDVAAHSRISDTRTALAMIAQRLRAALPKL